MTIRKRDDSIKGGCGIDGGLGEDYTKRHNVSDMQFAYPGADKRQRSRAGAYTENESGLTRTDDFEHGAGERQIWQDVEANQDEVDRPNNAIRAGVDRGQK